MVNGDNSSGCRMEAFLELCNACPLDVISRINISVLIVRQVAYLVRDFHSFDWKDIDFLNEIIRLESHRLRKSSFPNQDVEVTHRR